MDSDDDVEAEAETDVERAEAVVAQSGEEAHGEEAEVVEAETATDVTEAEAEGEADADAETEGEADLEAEANADVAAEVEDAEAEGEADLEAEAEDEAEAEVAEAEVEDADADAEIVSADGAQEGDAEADAPADAGDDSEVVIEDDQVTAEAEDDRDDNWSALSTRILGLPIDNTDASTSEPAETASVASDEDAAEDDAPAAPATGNGDGNGDDDDAVIAAFMNAHRTETARQDEPLIEEEDIAGAPALSAIAALIDAEEEDEDDQPAAADAEPADIPDAPEVADVPAEEEDASPLTLDIREEAQPETAAPDAGAETPIEAKADEADTDGQRDLAGDLAALVALAETEDDTVEEEPVEDPAPMPEAEIQAEADDPADTPLSLVAESDEDSDDREDAIASDSFDTDHEAPLDSGLVADDFAASVDDTAENIDFDALPSGETIADKLARMRAAMPSFDDEGSEDEMPSPVRRVSEAIFVQSAETPMASDGRPEVIADETADATPVEIEDPSDDADGFEDEFDDMEAMEEDWVEEAAVTGDTQDDGEEVELSDADEEDLQAELARIAEESEREANRAKRESRRIMLNSDRDADTGAAETSRLFEATASRLSTAETSRRLANFEHLKAAVAARAADRQMAEREAREQDEKTAEYREDLARVMRPRRVQVDTSRREAGADQNPAASPLVLVTEQRVEETRAPAAQTTPSSVGGLALAEEIEPEVFEVEAPQPLRLENADPASLAEADDLAEPEIAEAATEPEAEAPTETEQRGGGIGSSLVNLGLRTGILRRVEDAGDDAPAPAPEAAPEAVTEAAAPEETDLGAGLVPEEAPAPELANEPSAEQGDGLTDAFRAHAGAPDQDRPQDYLELAAAWMLRHEEQPAVSRPVLMRLVTIASDGVIGREEALRAFGILLREGKLEKIARGQFRLTSRSRHYNG